MTPNPKDSLLPDVKPVTIEKTDRDPADFEDDVEDTGGCRGILFDIGDMLFTSVVVAPQVINIWHAVWLIMDSNSNFFPLVQTYILGMLIHISFSLVRARLLSRSTGAWRREKRAGHWLRERFLSRIYTYVFLIACVMHWRGGFVLFDMLIDSIIDAKDARKPMLIGVITFALYLATTCLRSSRNILASPYFLITDGKESTYIYTTRYQSKSSKETMLYILDCVFSVTVVGSLVVFVWRGSWALLDIFLYPDDPAKSFWTSLVVGYGVVVVTFGLQAPMRWAAARLHGAPRLLLADVYHLVSFLATVNVWRGVWGLLDIYFFPESPKLSNWCSHIVSLALLILLNCSNSVLVRGVYIDAEEPAGDCVVFPCHYLRLFFHKERTKKRHKRALVAAASAAARKTEEASVPLQIPEEKV